MDNSNTMTDRTCEILEYLYSTEKAVGVSKISNDLDLPKATVFRILQALEKWQFVQKKEDSDEYNLGLGMIKYGAKLTSDMTLVTISKSLINALSIQIGESVNLNIPYQDQTLNIYQSPNANYILISKLTPISALNCSASGKIFLSQKSTDAIALYFNHGLYSNRTINSITDYQSFKKNIESITDKGIAYDDEEYEYGLFCFAAPVYHNDLIIASLSVSGPKTRLQYKGLEDLESELKSVSEQISKLIENIDLNHLL